ncbi:MAG: CRISPR-associated endonuclease Cas3'' [Oligosphaeraceae bacterium]
MGNIQRNEMIEVPYAHSIDGSPIENWQTLEEHSRGVAELAAEFASVFDSAPLARLLGAYHDAGKARTSFQNYLLRSNGLVPEKEGGENHVHSSVGALFLKDNLKGFGPFLAYAIAGHHAGLGNWCGEKSLKMRWEQDKKHLQESPVKQWLEEEKEKYSLTSAVSFRPRCIKRKEDISFWIRMLFSCLVDADFLDTEKFLDSEKSEGRKGYASLTILSDLFDKKIRELESQAEGKKSRINGIRQEIRLACERAAEWEPGFFSLTVPTGGGKTFSSTSFAFQHARKHGMRRIIYVIPYTSIIEQTADELSRFLGRENVLEHHCNLELGKYDSSEMERRWRLSSENWDAPVIVTTAVQFFESLYGNRTSVCRKLHNIAGSVVILDEVQLLPPSLLLPIAESIYQLGKNYGCSVVMSTATQTSLGEIRPMKMESIREIIPQEMDLYRRLKRTKIELPQPSGPRMTWESLAGELRKYPQVLCIVNTRRDARDLYRVMPEGTLHLSASMCGQHRSKVIQEIRDRLKQGFEVRVVSTQLIEAGVDVDFPIVYRAYTGLPSIVQSAGRCNREGRNVEGRVVVFLPPTPSPKGELRWYEDTLTDLLAANPGLDVDSREVFPEFYQKFYNRQHDLGTEFNELLSRDAGGAQFQFAEAAEKFRMIDPEGSVSVIVNFQEEDSEGNSKGNEALLALLGKIGPNKDLMRKLQRYTVSVPRGLFDKLVRLGGIVEGYPGSDVYVQGCSSLYDKETGLDMGWEGLNLEDCLC